ncbi:phospholipase D-like domain-containing protein, partial [Phaeovulum sp.]|uniref:phospholipase D-like domain-containing protein n=1 Tax=Phaeovulum sp. TaxID=2934796 RepID=UPI0039E3367F
MVLGLILLSVVTSAALWTLRRRFRHLVAQPRTNSTTLTPPPGAPLPHALAPALTQHPDLTGIHTLYDPLDALASRLELTGAATSSIDVQYYMWRRDTAGLMLLGALFDAADRGVRVRLLLDDNTTAGMDDTLAHFVTHPNIELRLFNPFPMRRMRTLGYLLDFARLNRRMHNKAMVFDATLAILGGRNIADDYFNDFASGMFMDLDIVAAGPVVADVSAQFDAYWASPLAVPARHVLHPLRPARARALVRARRELLAKPQAATYSAALAETPFLPRLDQPDAGFRWVEAELLVDAPNKAEGRARDRDLLWPYLLRALGTPARELDVISPYLVPTATGVRALAKIATGGVRVRILTNALAVSDVGIVHAGYAHRRKPLLRAGIQLYEYAGENAPRRDPEHKLDLLGRRRKGTSPYSRNKLHAKVFSADRARVFIGSLNFDPRSLWLNTEMGVVIHSPEMAADLAEIFNAAIEDRAY